MSKVWKAHQLHISEPWRPCLAAKPDTIAASAQIGHSKKLKARKAAAPILQQARTQADELLQAAYERAEEILAAAQEEYQQQQEAGYQAGWQAGQADGEAQGRAAWEEKLAQLQASQQELVNKDAEWLQESQAEQIAIAVAIAQRVIGIKLHNDDAAVRAAVQQVLQAVNHCREALLLVSPQDFEHLWPRRQEWQSYLPGVKEFAMEADPKLKKGDILLQTNQGIVDARLSTVLEQVANLAPAAEGMSE